MSSGFSEKQGFVGVAQCRGLTKSPSGRSYFVFALKYKSAEEKLTWHESAQLAVSRKGFLRNLLRNKCSAVVCDDHDALIICNN